MEKASSIVVRENSSPLLHEPEPINGKDMAFTTDLLMDSLVAIQIRSHHSSGLNGANRACSGDILRLPWQYTIILNQVPSLLSGPVADAHHR